MSKDAARREAFEERAAIMEYDAGMTRAQAEAKAQIELMPAEKITPGYAAFKAFCNNRRPGYARR